MSLLAVLLVIGMAFSSGFAQAPGGNVFCGDLEEADCEILVNSQEAMGTVDSMAFVSEGAFTVNVDGLAITIDLNMDGAYSVDMSALMAMQDPAMGMDMMNDPALMNEMMTMYGAVLNDATAHINMSMGLPGFLLGPDAPSELNMQMVAQDGIFYIYAEDVDTGTGEWIGLDLSNFSEEYAALLEESMAGMDESGMSMEDFANIYDSEFYLLMQDAEFWNDYVTVTRLGDEEVNGQAVAVFITEYDYAGALADERFSAAFDDYINSIIDMLGEDMGEDPEMSPEELSAFFSDLTQTLLNNMEMQQVVWIGLDDGYVYHTEADFSIEVDMESLAQVIEEFSGEPVDMDEMGFRTMTFSMTFTTDSSAFNEAVEVEVPADVEIVDPFEEMSATGSGMMDG